MRLPSPPGAPRAHAPLCAQAAHSQQLVDEYVGRQADQQRETHAKMAALLNRRVPAALPWARAQLGAGAGRSGRGSAWKLGQQVRGA